MAELTKQLKLKTTEGEEQACKLYSTREEANARGGVLPLVVDGVACFAALGALNEDEATRGRQEKNGVKMAMLKRGTLPPGSITYDFAESGAVKTFTVPHGVKMLRISSRQFNPDTTSLGDADLYYMPVIQGEALTVDLEIVHNEETARDENYFVIGGIDFFLDGTDTDVTLSWSEAINKHPSKVTRR